MNERFLRCPHCGMPHEESREACPATGKAIDRVSASRLGPTRSAPSPAAAPSKPAPAPESPRRPAPRPPSYHGGTGSYSMPRRDLIGKTIGGKYNIRAILGEGGMGTVFEALNLAIGRQVAIKVLHATQLRKKDAVRRFHQEARAAGAIGHPNICEVYDLGTLEDGCPYLVMEKLVGETLADRIAREGGLPAAEVVDVVTQVLSGLVAAHEKGIVHRDIKPENVFLTKRVGCPPVAKLVDFGVSKIIAAQRAESDDQELDLTRTGIVLGTPYYLAPEQARGDRNLDARVDLYAAGVVLYEALTGRRPFTASNYNALLINILTKSPRPPRELRPDLPAAFDAVLRKAMAREPFDRYQTAVEFQQDLQRIGLGRSGARTPPPVPVAAGSAPARHPTSPPPPLPAAAQGSSASAREPGARALHSTGRNAAAKRAGVPADFTLPPSQPPPPPARKAPLVSAPRPPALPQGALGRGPAGIGPGSTAPPAVPRPSPAVTPRKVSQGFDDLPTEVQAPDLLRYGVGVEEHDPTSLMDDRDVRRILASARPTRGGDKPRDGYLVDFRDDNKTEVTSEQRQQELDAIAEESAQPAPVAPARVPRPRR